MAEHEGWDVDSRQYKKVPRQSGPEADDVRSTNARHIEALGFSWDSSSVPWHVMLPMPVKRATARFQGQLASHVWDAAALEGNPYTLPEVQTLLEGVTVGGHRLDDEQQVLALGESTKRLRDLVNSERFEASKLISDGLHAIVAPHEAIESGHFRGEGTAGGGGTVNLGERGTFRATGCDDGGEALRDEYDQGLRFLSALKNPVERGITYFCFGARGQFYFDGNKRTSRLMMNGILMASGHDAISIPFNRRLEFNQHLIALCADADATPLMQFIVDCRPES